MSKGLCQQWREAVKNVIDGHPLWTQKPLAGSGHESVHEIRAVAARGKRVVDQLLSCPVLIGDALLAKQAQTIDNGAEKVVQVVAESTGKVHEGPVPGTEWR